ncbi:putative bifunctional diguanylate cyclase/phosphodiesterase [Propylenella binzhouense]|uniref:EAL domain-containing protein n=1 Tax=Propylenella binzhouense TaxID=2555902 RepID=A0A964WTY3_9HYPH|nr:EAL domain-containing protein [Propylenella binzhouense]MYZ48290.1 EAL domain-containing protein [Propylenella binzhouense]
MREDGRVSSTVAEPAASARRSFKGLFDLLGRRRRWSGMASALARARRQAEAAEEKAREAEGQLRDALEALPEGIVFLDAEGRYILWNRRYEEIYEGSADLFAPGVKLADTLRIGVERGQYPEAIGREEEWLAERLAHFDRPGGRHEQQLADGRWIMIEERATSGGGTIGIRVDITEMKQREASFRLLFQDNPVPMFLYDRETLRITGVNARAAAHYGYRPERLTGSSILGIFDDPSPEDRALIRRLGERTQGSERTWRHRKADGKAIEVTLFASELTSDGRPTIVLAAIDVTERRKAEARVAHMARHDALTGLANRVHHRERVEQALAELAATGTGFATLLIDLDNFKAVNDTLGHSIGDKLLVGIAERLRACAGDAATVARLGGDEFVMLLPASDEEELRAIAERVVAEVSEPVEIESHRIVVGASVGIAIAPQHGENPDRLLKSADVALYQAKADGKGRSRFFEQGMDEHLLARRSLELDLRTALAAGDLQLYYQPLVNLSDEGVVGFEALLRWHHPERGWVSPEQFIPLAEEIGLIGDIGRMVLQRACRDAMAWPPDMKVAVNLSPMQFKTCKVLETVVSALAQSGLAPERLEIEITEALLVERTESVLATLNGLRALGVGISMDDFGTGYSSLSYLRSFPFTKIKIDRSFMRNLGSCSESRAIVRAIVGLGASLKMTVTAEGIERAEDLAYLQGEGCMEGQGFYFSPARPPEELAELMGSIGRRSAA